MKLLSAVVPCYNEEENIADFYQEFMKNEAFFRENGVELELWYIDDGSRDNTVSEVKKLCYQESETGISSSPDSGTTLGIPIERSAWSLGESVRPWGVQGSSL